MPALRLDSLRNRILAVAVLATLIPSGITLGIAYEQNRRANEEKVAQDLLSSSSQSARAVGVWLKERLYDLRIFANSNEVSDNLGRALRGEGGTPTQGRLAEYLRSLHSRFPDFAQLFVLDPRGRVVATSAPRLGEVHLPSEWATKLRDDKQVVGDAFWEGDGAGGGRVTVAVPVTLPTGQLLGAFAADLSLGQVREVIRAFVRDSSGDLVLTTTGGGLVASARDMSARTVTTVIARPTLDLLLNNETGILTYRGVSGQEVLGTYRKVPQVRWAVIAESPTETALGQVRSFRNFALAVVLLLLVTVTVIAYRLGLIIVRPLDLLTRGASEVAHGNLTVDLPTGAAGEVGYLTQMFNQMVSSLRSSRAELDAANELLRVRNVELERLSTTDPLTNLSNRRFLMQRLDEETVRTGRSQHPFAVLMADVDNFKKYNDQNGHPAGDDVLRKVAQVMRDSARAMDCVARYGGEEFCIMLPDTPAEAAVQLAERIRGRIESMKFEGGKVTTSIGVASLPEDGVTTDAVVSAADAALYEAKRAGRNRVARYKGPKKG